MNRAGTLKKILTTNHTNQSPRIEESRVLVRYTHELGVRKPPVFSKGCFWDMDYEKLDLENSKNFIITRVVSHGGSSDEIELFAYYGWETIKEEVVKIRYLNKKILNYLSLLLDINKENFRCYKNGSIY